MTDFSAQVVISPTPPLPDAAETIAMALTDALPDSAVTVDTRSITATFTATAANIQGATEAARKALRDALRELGVRPGEPVKVEAMTYEQRDRENEEPNYPDLVSTHEVAMMLGGVTRQRVHQLKNDHRLFPAPFLELGSGPLWLRGSIEAFERSWTRKSGRPAKSDTAESAPQVGHTPSRAVS